jgi:hypothetical protein
MEPSAKRFSRPVYESLPWLYMSCGIAASVGSYFLPSGALSFLVACIGFAALLVGIVIQLRRWEYRRLRSQYSDPDALKLAVPPEEKDA